LNDTSLKLDNSFTEEIQEKSAIRHIPNVNVSVQVDIEIKPPQKCIIKTCNQLNLNPISAKLKPEEKKEG